MSFSEDGQGNLLVLTVGLPKSGKSTWAKTKNCPIVSPDAIRLALHSSPFNAEAEQMVWTLAKYMVKSLFLAGHQLVILDACSTTRARRDEWKSVRWKRRYMIIKTPKEECLRRSQDTPDLLPVIERMASQYEEPALDEWDDLYLQQKPQETT